MSAGPTDDPSVDLTVEFEITMSHTLFPVGSANRKEGNNVPLIADNTLPANSPPGFHLLAKPSGSTCNIDCKYCFFLSKEALYPNDKQRMSEHTLETYIQQLLESHRTPQFGDDKRDSLTAQCRNCEVRPLSNGGCPKDRFVLSRDGEPGQSYLCAGLELFFTHTRPAMRTMAQLLRQRRPPSEVMALTAAEDDEGGPYQACPCGSGRKFRFCHGDNAPDSSFTGVDPISQQMEQQYDA